MARPATDPSQPHPADAGLVAARHVMLVEHREVLVRQHERSLRGEVSLRRSACRLIVPLPVKVTAVTRSARTSDMKVAYVSFVTFWDGGLTRATATKASTERGGEAEPEHHTAETRGLLGRSRRASGLYVRSTGTGVVPAHGPVPSVCHGSMRSHTAGRTEGSNVLWSATGTFDPGPQGRLSLP